MDAITQPWDGLNKLKEKVKTATGSQLVDIWKSMGTFLEAVQLDQNKSFPNPVYTPAKDALRGKLLMYNAVSNYNHSFNLDMMGGRLDTVQLLQIAEQTRGYLIRAIDHLETVISLPQKQELVDLFDNDYSYRILRDETPSFSERWTALSIVTEPGLDECSYKWLGDAIAFLRDLLLSGAIQLEHKDSAVTVQEAFKTKLQEIGAIKKVFEDQRKFMMSVDERRELRDKLMELQFADGKNIFEKFAIWGAKYQVPVVVENVAPGAANI